MKSTILRFSLHIILYFAFSSCIRSQISEIENKTLNKPTLRFIGEQLIPDNFIFQNTLVGGLSGIEYANDTWYLISDDSKSPIRFYEMNLQFNDASFTAVEVLNVNEFLNTDGKPFESKTIDAESIRFDDASSKFIWTSEGALPKGIAPTLYETDPETLISKPIYQIPKANTSIPNGSLEGLSLGFEEKGYWLGMELPFSSDGEVPTFDTNSSPIRLSFFDKDLKKITAQYAYMLDKVGRKPKNISDLAINGLVELLALNETQFLTMERSYTAGYGSEGNVVKIYLSTITNATDITLIESLKETPFTPIKKELILDVNTLKNKLPSKHIDNIEGICLGPKLSNGNNSLVIVADNNFNKFGKQINQFIVFELIP